MTDLAEEGFPICLKQKPDEAGFIKNADFDILSERLTELASPDRSG